MPAAAVTACYELLANHDPAEKPFPKDPERSFSYDVKDRKVTVCFRAVRCREGDGWRWSCLNEVEG